LSIAEKSGSACSPGTWLMSGRLAHVAAVVAI
jgi:hypothetical protein